jgi:nucleoside 2-deoxyribosyltransferase
MKVYCAGPLFVPYEREFMSKCGQALRESGIDPFVPHESFAQDLPPNTLHLLRERGLTNERDLTGQPLANLVRDLLRKDLIKREDLGLPSGPSAKRVFDKDFGAIAESNAMLAVINGTEVDDGTACEIGIFYALMQTDPTKKGIVAVHNDWRTMGSPGEGKGLNAFVSGCLLKGGIVHRELKDAVKQISAWQAELQSEGLL